MPIKRLITTINRFFPNIFTCDVISGVTIEIEKEFVSTFFFSRQIGVETPRLRLGGVVRRRRRRRRRLIGWRLWLGLGGCAASARRSLVGAFVAADGAAPAALAADDAAFAAAAVDDAVDHDVGRRRRRRIDRRRRRRPSHRWAAPSVAREGHGAHRHPARGPLLGPSARGAQRDGGSHEGTPSRHLAQHFSTRGTVHILGTSISIKWTTRWKLRKINSLERISCSWNHFSPVFFEIS